METANVPESAEIFVAAHADDFKAWTDQGGSIPVYDDDFVGLLMPFMVMAYLLKEGFFPWNQLEQQLDTTLPGCDGSVLIP
eukprot:scaffold9572_cov157-Amphora_coffeaeformis.AAC.3